MDPETQLENFRTAVDLIGGQGATARALDISERSVRLMLAGRRRLLTGHLQDMAKALLAHAAACRDMERRISPAFAGNLSEAQAKPPHHAGKHTTPHRHRPEVKAAAARLGLTPKD